jgi:hypothetical protein
MLKSFIALHPECKILVADNSSDTKTEELLRGGNVPFFKNGGGLHGPTVDLLLQRIDTKYALLVDTDVIFLKNHDEIFQQLISLDLTLMGDIEGDRGGKRIHKRVHPWHCFINADNVKTNQINFYDKKRMLEKESIIYDVGSSFFEDVRSKKLKVADFKGNNVYYKHYEGMSWRVNKFKKNIKGGDIDNVATATHDDEGLYMYGQHINQIYQNETKKFLSIKLNYERN